MLLLLSSLLPRISRRKILMQMMGKDNMSHNAVILDLDSAVERFQLFNKTYPAEALDTFFEFDSRVDTSVNLQRLSQLVLSKRFHTGYLFVYKPIFLEILSRWINYHDKLEECVEVFDACSRNIGLFPVSKPLVEQFLVHNNEHIITILQNHSIRSEQELRTILLAYYRLLYHDKEVFGQYVKPNVLYSLVDSTKKDIITFLALKILSIYLEAGERVIDEMLDAHVDGEGGLYGEYELDSHVDYRFLELNEAKRFANFSRLPEVSECFQRIPGRHYVVLEPEYLSQGVVSICGTLVPFSKLQQPIENSSFVPTEKSINALRQLANNIRNAEPIMLCGNAGSGKTFLVNQLSKYAGREQSMVKIHLGDQTDAKLLIGTYTSGEKPGTFEWRPGVLTTAVKQGRWVLIEDIDKAPTEVLSVLLTLLEKRELTIPSRGETVKASHGFHLISTVRIDETQSKRNVDSNSINIIGSRIWKLTHLEELDDKDLHYILCHRYPVLTRLVPKLTHAYKAVKEIYLDQRFTSLNKGAKARIISVRDLMKLCERLKVLFENNDINNPDELIESGIFDNIFAEAADCFTGAISEPRALEPLVKTIGESLEISTSRISLYLSKHVPQFDSYPDHLEIGRAILPKAVSVLQKKSANATSFATTNHSLKLMEQISVAVQMTEPVLLVGETGTGKTTVVQHLCRLLNKTLTVINVSQQTETGDLLGGYKPVNSKTIAIPIQEKFESLFAITFSLKKNEQFYKMLHKCFNKDQWKNVVRLWKEAYKMATNILKVQKISDDDNGEKRKKKRKLNEHEQKLLLETWEEFNSAVEKFEFQSSSIENSLVFDFVEGALVKAVRNGEWLLLDEINLASPDTLESISDLLDEGSKRGVLLSDKGDIEPVRAHPNFRIFACMNPATDVGKRDLPPGIRSRFTEIYVHSPDRDITDLLSIIDKYIKNYSTSDEWVGNDVAELYLEAKKLAESNQIVDGSNQKPHFSIRTLTRTLLYVCDIVNIYGLRRSLYDGFCMSFLTLLDGDSEAILEPIIRKYTLGRLKNVKAVVSQAPPSPGPDYIQFRHYWIRKGSFEPKEEGRYIITPFVEKNMMNLVRATSSKRFPVLIEGPTSAGKTSMIKYLADITGHKFVRINNHEHTDLQEYLGTYVTDDTGKLSFQEGILVEALRKGYWIVLDELNLAPTDILEALNRLLDDNRELLIPETQEIVHPHSDFMLFATQNPPGIYGGRKILSRAFRNRFLELHFADIPQDELEIILRERCQIAPSYAKRIVEVYRQLSVERSASRLFEQKNSFATLRDLFRWALRDAIGYEQLAANGYMLLAERCRTAPEREVIKRVLEKVMRVKLDMEKYYSDLENSALLGEKSDIVWTGALRRLSVLVETCLRNREPVLLVGETGCGKTTICQILASYYGKNLITLNAHQNTETSDILGAQRPVRNRSEIQSRLTQLLQGVLDLPEDQLEMLTLEGLIAQYDSMDKTSLNENTKIQIDELRNNLSILFEWCDGPLVHAMNNGDFFLLDEISLADDSVLERLNSVLEPERNLLLAEKGSSGSLVIGAEEFQFLATMNPGGDYGKKELSPALRNRFTEIWVSSMDNLEDVRMIVFSKLLPDLRDLVDIVVSFCEWYANKFGRGMSSGGIISLRDVLAWIEFMNCTYHKVGDKGIILVEGAAMVFIDALGTNNTAYLAESPEKLKELKQECIAHLSKFASTDLKLHFNQAVQVQTSDTSLRIGPFELHRKEQGEVTTKFNWNAPTTSKNLLRVVRAMQVRKPILLEGSPGVGKTSLVAALSELTGNKLTRINLSEHTDLVDLFGSDVPGEKTGEFVWRDAPFLRAMQKGEWVLLDEMNLASQSVLEGLNACLDHRGQAYIPELDRSFSCHPEFMVFAAQNPQYQGGGRKGLPKSFINRFNVVYNDTLSSDDLLLIANQLYPDANPDVIKKIIQLMSTLEYEVCKLKKWGSSGSPWEFNLRDTLRWLKMLNQKSLVSNLNIFDFVDVVVVQRFRSHIDKSRAREVVERIFGVHEKRENFYKLDRDFIQVNRELVKRNPLFSCPTHEKLLSLESNFSFYESSLRAIKHSWPLILVGPTNSGKSGIIEFLASVLGARVSTFSMNNDVDSMDILGGYEQVDLTRKISYIVNDLKLVLREILLVNLGLNVRNREPIIGALELLNFLCTNVVSVKNFDYFTEKFNRIFSFLYDSPQLQEFSSRIQNMSTIIDQGDQVKFEWFDGMLVEAVEKGNWLVLDNANLCSPSVLDRLNSLLESDGSLIINECSEENGEPRVVTPHRNFRLFLTVNPKYGELSRAMRNRGVELYVEELHSRVSYYDCLNLGLEASKETSQLENGCKAMSLCILDSIAPLKRYLPAQLASTQVFGQLHDVISLSGDQPATETLLGMFPINRLKELEQWMKNVFENRQFSEQRVALEIYELLKTFNESDVVQKVNNMYSSADERVEKLLELPSSDISNQSLLPLLNTYLLPSILSAQAEEGASEIVYLFSTVEFLHKTINLLEETMEKAIKGKLSSLSYIELSAAVVGGRNVKNPPRIPIFQVLQDLTNRVWQIVNQEALFQRKSIFESLWKLLILWFGIFETAGRKDEARLRAYKELLDEWQASAQHEGLITSEFSFLSKFSDGVRLQRGTSIALIWDNFKQPYPSSPEGWSLWDALFDISKKFDHVVKSQYVESYGSINGLREIFRMLFEDLLQNDVVEFRNLLVKLESGIEELESISSKFLNKRINYFEDEFDDLLRLVFDQQNGMVEQLASLSSIPTGKIIRQQQKRYCYPAVFDILWTEADDKFQSSVNSLVTSSLFERIIIKSNNLKNFAGSQLKQTLMDAKLLLSSTVDSSETILQDQLMFFGELLRHWVVRIIQLHVKEEVISFDLEQLQKQVSTETDEIFQKVFVENLLPALQYATSASSFSVLGRGWILFGIGMMELYAPDRPFDPAIHEYVSYDTFSKYKSFTEKIKESFISVRQVTSGDDPIFAEKVLLEQPNVGELERPQIYRPDSPIDNLFDEWTALLNSSLNHEQVFQLMNTVDDWSSITKGQLELFQQNTSRFLQRLETGYKFYMDLNDIFSSYVLSMKFGFDLMRCDRDGKEKDLDLPLLWSVDPLTLVSPKSINNTFSKLSSFFKRNNTNSASSEVVLAFLMQLFKFHNKPESMLSTFNGILQTLYFRWSQRRMKEEQEARERSSVFRFEDTTDDFEQDFKNMFPDYEETVSADYEGSSSSYDELQDAYYSIAKIYISTFQDSKGRNLESMVEMGSKVVEQLARSSLKLKTGTLSEKHLTAVVHLLSKNIEAFGMPKNNENLNFYKDFSISESQKAITIVENLWKFVHELLGNWPEHATLRELFRICHEFLSYRSSTPVAKMLQKIEQIYTFVAEWEKYASSQVSMSSHIRKITDLIISWRKMELQTWNALLKTEEEEINKNIGKWWFYLFEIIIVSGISDKSANDSQTTLVSHLNIFFSKSSYGEFKTRLNLLRAFSEHTKLLGWSECSIFHSIQNVLKFYGQFESAVEEHIANSRKSLEKEISEIILLASWKDVNIDALKQSSRRSHNNLYKVVRKYRSVLSEAVQQTVEGGISFSIKELLPMKTLMASHSMDYDVISAAEQVKKISGWDSRSEIMKNPNNVYSKMKFFIAKMENLNFPSLLDFATDISKEAENLQKDTPKVYSKDQKKKLASLKVLKGKLLSDSLKELRRIGLKSSFREDIHKVQSTSTAVLSNVVSFSGTELEGCDGYFFRIIDLLPKLRAAVSEPSDNIPFASIEKGMAIAENLIFSLITVRQPIHNLGVIHCKYQELLDDLEAISFSRGTLNHNSMCMNFEQLKKVGEWFPVLLEYAIVTLSFIKQEKTKKNTVELEHIRGKTQEFYTRLCTVRVLDSTTDELLNEFNEFLFDIMKSLKRFRNPQNFFVFDVLLSWLNEQPRFPVKDLKSEDGRAEDFDQIFRGIFTSLVLSFQKIMNMELLSFSEDDDKWLSTTAKQLMNVNKVFINSNILQKLEQAIKQIKETQIAGPNVTLVRALITFTLPAIKSYHEAMSAWLLKSRDYYVSTSHGTYVLATILHNLAKNGFCSPEPPSDMQDDKNLHEGTGLGDGEGAQNNSKDVEEDEDLTENAQEANRDEDNKDEEDPNEDKNDAVDMEGDMAGDLEELSNQGSDSEQSGDEDENEMDEQVDDVNEDDPNAIDDKMWDEKPESDSKEKNAENNVEGQKDDDDVQAAEGDDNKNDNNQQQQGEDENNNEEFDDANKEDKSNEEGSDKEGEDKEEDGEDGEDDAAGQDDSVRQEEGEENAIDAPEIETLDLPEDMNLDSGDEKSEDEGDDENMDVSDGDMGDEDEGEEDEKHEENAEAAEPEDQDHGDEAEDGADSKDAEEEDQLIDDEEEGVKSEEEKGADEAGEAEEDENMSDENELAETQMGENAEQEKGNDEQAEGLDGLDEVPDPEDVDADAAAQQKSGSKGAGSESKDTDEQDNVGNSGNAQNYQEEQQEQEQENNEASREDAKEAFKQLGDSMKEYYKRRKEIQEASQREKEEETMEKSNERPEDFEHVDGANTESDTQALGMANQEQILPIDQDKAIDDDEEPRNEDEDIQMLDEEQEAEKEYGQPEENEAGEENENTRATGASVGEIKEDTERGNLLAEDILQNREEDDLEPLLEEIDEEVHQQESLAEPCRDLDESRALWHKSELSTSELSARLSEQLRLILEPTLATKLQGDYKTGKRLNMKRIIPYIASQFRKDKIWLRRTKPSKRQYQIMIALDDSKSMSESKCVKLAFDSLCLVSKTLTQLESGGLSIVKFGETVREVHPFGEQFSSEAGAKAFQWFGFQETKTDIRRLVAESIKIFERSSVFASGDQWRLQIVISDGVCEDHETVQRLVRRARENKIMIVFVIIDGINSSESIMDMSQVKYVTDHNGNMQLKIDKYLDTFPFEFYVVVHDISELPEMLSVILRQYFADLASS
ncbi:hypothetical protein ZYGR_0AK02730 [Zygosaccharomyces rouxii]|uniref:Midasin n=1 Tax=Zygosaccharomyces rouxii TaxID=4956 RepID=A0A1Q3ADM5_ZYGRO|nr:hypothetical protein ZYGR_0AK02730 [Zygosaccharomyces rouxii]